ncbi:MAG: protein kinase [Gammaproteobacteria bacterium]
MSAEPKRVTQTEVWAEWESQVVNGVFPLRRFLGGSDHSAVFLTEYEAEGVVDAAIKLIPADTLHSQAQLVQWVATAALAHPHLMRLFDVGRCRFEGREFLFVVMEHAEQTLAQILPQRALSAEETREMLLPTVGALAFLHRNQLAHGQLKPSNILVVGDQLKLSSDSVRAIGAAPSGIVRASSYDAPELKDGETSVAGDMWGLGMTLLEALTQHAPAWADERSEAASWAANLPAPFAETVQKCLSLAPVKRPTALELETLYKPAAPQPQVIPVSRTPTSEAPVQATPAPSLPTKSLPTKSLPTKSLPTKSPPTINLPEKNLPAKIPPSRGLLLPVAAALVVSLAIWIGLHISGTDSSSPDTNVSNSTMPESSLPEAQSAPAQVNSQPPAAPAAPAPLAKAVEPAAPESESVIESPAAPASDQPSLPTITSVSVLHEAIPDVPRPIREKIRGTVRVTMRVLVDPAGNVVGQFLEKAGPSRYFARVSGDAAGEWKFVPTEERGSRVWLLRFEFTRRGVSARASAAQ